MSDFLEQLNRRLRRKRAEEPIRRSVESDASYRLSSLVKGGR